MNMTSQYVPQTSFRIRKDGDWDVLEYDQLFKDKRVVVFSLPGAFTPTCSNTQLPNYDLMYPQFKALGIDAVYCVSVNDPFVMSAWFAELEIENVKAIPDGNMDFTRGMGMLVHKADKNFGMRSWRYAMVVENGQVLQMFVEPGKDDNVAEDPYGESSPEMVLKYCEYLNARDALVIAGA